MEDALEAARAAGLTEAEFWDSTPYLTNLAVRGIGRRAFEQAIMTGWMAERFAREERLQGLAGYIQEFTGPGLPPDLAEAMAEAELTRMAMGWGLTVEDVDEAAVGA